MPEKKKPSKKSNAKRKMSIREKSRKPLGSLNVSIKIPKKQVVLKARGPYTSIRIKKGVSRGEPGHPALPWCKFYVSVPKDAVALKLSVINTKAVTLAKDVTIEPCQPDVPTLIGNRVEWVVPEQKVYASKVIWPKEYCRLSTVRIMGGFAIAEIELCPFRYNLSSRDLDLIERLDLSLAYNQKRQKISKPSTIMTFKHEQKFMEKVKNMVLNPKDVELYRDIQDLKDITDLSTYPQLDHIIITSDALAESFHRLADWRTRMGLRCRVVTVEDIVSGTVPDTCGEIFWQTSGYSDGGTRDAAEAIRNFIKWASVNWLIDYVLIGGDTEIVPVRQAIHLQAGTLSYGDINFPDLSVTLGYSPNSSSQKAGTSAANVLDDDPTTVWECDAGDTDPWIRLSVGSHKPVNRVDLTWNATHASSYKIQVSHDGTSWTDVHSTTSGPGGTEQIGFSCASASYVRMQILSGTNFSLATMKIYGPSKSKYGGRSYSISNTVTRVYLSHYLIPNPTNSIDDNLIIIKDGPQAGTIVPYDTAANNTTLGWRFIQDLVDSPSSVSTTATFYVEICGPATYHGNSFGIKDSYNYIPTDLYYSDIGASEYPPSGNHDWDADNNGIYGERHGGEIDGVNGIADVYIGRAPVETVQEADTFIDKIIRYENYIDPDGFLLPLHFATSVLLGSQNWGHTEVPGSLDLSAMGKEDIRESYLTFDPARWIFTRRYQDHADVPAADQTANLAEANKDEILNAIRDGNHVVSLSSHGSSGYLCYLVTDDIDDVVNYPAIFYGNACSTNKFDVAAGEALGEWTVLNGNGGAVAYIGNSRFGWTGDNPIELEFWVEMLTSERLGEMFNACKLIRSGWQSYSLNLMGDPGMRVWSDRPQQLCVTHPEKISTGNQTFTVSAMSDGQPVNNTIVCLSMDGSLFATGTTDTSGTAQIPISPSIEGTMKVTVSGKNLIPYLGNTEVEKVDTGCTKIIFCGANLTCLPDIACKAMIGCTKLISCTKQIACKIEILCREKILCTKAIQCTNLISCGLEISCGVSIVCKHSIACKQMISCGQQIVCPRLVDVCPRILPKEFDKIREQVHEIWGVRNVIEFAKNLESHEIDVMVEELPHEMRKQFRLMVARIQEEDQID